MSKQLDLYLKKLCSIPNQRPQLLTIRTNVIPQLPFHPSDRCDWILKSILPRAEGFGVWGFSRHVVLEQEICAEAFPMRVGCGEKGERCTQSIHR